MSTGPSRIIGGSSRCAGKDVVPPGRQGAARKDVARTGETCRGRERRAEDGRDVLMTWLPQDGPFEVRYRNLYRTVVCYSSSDIIS